MKSLILIVLFFYSLDAFSISSVQQNTACPFAKKAKLAVHMLGSDNRRVNNYKEPLMQFKEGKLDPLIDYWWAYEENQKDKTNQEAIKILNNPIDYPDGVILAFSKSSHSQTNFIGSNPYILEEYVLELSKTLYQILSFLNDESIKLIPQGLKKTITAKGETVYWRNDSDNDSISGNKKWNFNMTSENGKHRVSFFILAFANFYHPNHERHTAHNEIEIYFQPIPAFRKHMGNKKMEDKKKLHELIRNRFAKAGMRNYAKNDKDKKNCIVRNYNDLNAPIPAEAAKYIHDPDMENPGERQIIWWEIYSPADLTVSTPDLHELG